jgi:hypothetical protein
MRVQVAAPIKLLLRRSPHGVEIAPNELIVNSRSTSTRLPRLSVGRIDASTGFLWDSLKISSTVGTEGHVAVRWLPRGKAAMVARAWAAWGLAPRVQAAASSFRHLLARDAYFTHSELVAWQQTNGLGDTLHIDVDDLPLAEDQRARRAPPYAVPPMRRARRRPGRLGQACSSSRWHVVEE